MLAAPMHSLPTLRNFSATRLTIGISRLILKAAESSIRASRAKPLRLMNYLPDKP